jgi:WD40 repeat protein/serine/threonine protein kinase
MTERAIFQAALDIDDPTGRAAFVAEACGHDAGLRGQVEELLKAHQQPGAFMGRPAPDLFTTAAGGVPAECPGAMVGPYKLLEQIGEGGFGVVFMAEQARPVRRRVALKMLKPGMDSGQVVARFEAERQVLALMDHPHIAKVLDAGQTETGRPYFVMELVRGVPVTDFCDQSHLPVRQRLELFVSVCQAVQHAHQKGVIHRDLKPTNVLVTLHDGTPVAKVIDFGIAKAVGQQLTERTLFTNFAQMVGTPLYMSPEQAQMSGLDVDTRADIYALGVLLYELLTGTTPFDREQFRTAGYDEIRRIIREDEPPRPSTRLSTLGQAVATVSANRQTDPAGLRRQFRGELDWVVMKCLEKDRNRRYDTAAALAADVRRFLSDEPVQACPPSTGYRLRKFARRNRGPVAAGSALAALLVLGTVGTSVGLVWALQAERTATAAAAAETRATDGLKQALKGERVEAYFHRIALAHAALSADNLRRALELLEECPDDLRGWEWYFLRRACQLEPVVLTNGSSVFSLAFNSDGDRLASADGAGTLKVWDLGTGKVVWRLLDAHPRSVVSVAFHPDGRHLASVGADKRVKIWDMSTREKVFEDDCDAVHVYGTAYAVAFRPPNGGQLAVGNDGVVQIWDWADRRPVRSFAGHVRRPISVAFSRDGRHLASGTWRGEVRLWDLEGGDTPVRTVTDTRDTRHPACALAFGPDAGLLAAASFERRVDVWDQATGNTVHALTHDGLVLGVAISPDGLRLASTGEDKTVHVWELATGREVLGLRGHSGYCGCVAFSPEGWRLASAGSDGTIRIWDATPLRGHEGQEVLTFREHPYEIWTLAVSPDGRQVVSAGLNSPARVWDPQTGRTGAAFDGHRDVVFSVAWRPDGERVASAGADDGLFTVKVWDPQTGRADFTLEGIRPGDPEFFAVAFSRGDGRYLVTGRTDGTVQVWDGRTGKLVNTIGTHERPVRGVVFSPDGRHLASVSADGAVYLWDATKLPGPVEPRHRLDGRVHGPCLNVAFSPDGRRLATGGAKNTVKVWDVESGLLLRTLEGHTGDVNTVAFSPDPGGRWLASAGEDSTVKVWDSQADYALVRNIRGHTGLVSSLAFSRDGGRLLTGSRDHTVRVWDVSRLDEIPGR